MKKIPVVEIFGPTIQGEGLVTGTFTNFLRTGGCSLRCKWCDSMYAVDSEQVKENARMLDVPEITQAIEEHPWAPWMTLTGGDPCMWEELGDVVTWLNNRNTRVNVETQGMLFPDWLMHCDVITFSPKPPSSDNQVDIDASGGLVQWLISNGRNHKGQICIKVPIFDAEDIQYALDVYNTLTPENHIAPLYDSFYFTAGSGTAHLEEASDYLTDSLARMVDVLASQRDLVDALFHMQQETHVVKFNDKVHIGCQQHVLIWPEQSRGV